VTEGEEVVYQKREKGARGERLRPNSKDVPGKKGGHEEASEDSSSQILMALWERFCK